jgi:excinuclease UvrABC nuclease subunit
MSGKPTSASTRKSAVTAELAEKMARAADDPAADAEAAGESRARLRNLRTIQQRQNSETP